jgi:hypothetical protein
MGGIGCNAIARGRKKQPAKWIASPEAPGIREALACPHFFFEGGIAFVPEGLLRVVCYFNV